MGCNISKSHYLQHSVINSHTMRVLIRFVLIDTSLLARSMKLAENKSKGTAANRDYIKWSITQSRNKQKMNMEIVYRAYVLSSVNTNKCNIVHHLIDNPTCADVGYHCWTNEAALNSTDLSCFLWNVLCRLR